jgi:acetolactate synthase-1/2/3 large subunit
VDRQGIPFITTQMGKGVIDEAHSLCLGNAALSANDFLHRAIEKADVIINVGHDVVEKPPFFMRHGNLKVIHVNFNSASVDPVYFPQLEMIGDIANSIWQLNENLEPQSHWDFAYFLKTREAMLQHVCEGADDPRFPVYPQRLVRDVRQVMPEDGIIALDNGVYKIWFARNYPAHRPNTVLLDNALATMGAGLPSAMAARIAFPERKVVAICGDGGFMMNSQELETAVRLKLDLVVLILNDSAYGMIKWKQANMDFKNFGLDFKNPCFVKYADSYGAAGHRLEATEDLTGLLEKCLRVGGVHLIDIPVDYSDNDRILNRELPERSKTI